MSAAVPSSIVARLSRDCLAGIVTLLGLHSDTVRVKEHGLTRQRASLRQHVEGLQQQVAELERQIAESTDRLAFIDDELQECQVSQDAITAYSEEIQRALEAQGA